MLETYIIKIDNKLEKDAFDNLMNYISEEKKERISKFYRFEDAQRSLLGDILSRYAICKRTGLKNDRILFRKNEYGKPLLTESIGIHFNISHSGHWVVCAIDDNPVGIDVEEIKSINLKIAKRFFSNEEYESLKNMSEDDRLKHFFVLWSLKESYLKAKGKGLNIPLNSFTIKMQNQKINAFTYNGCEHYTFHHSFLDNNTTLAVCSSDDTISKKTIWNVADFYKEIIFTF
ncbi:4'-phosphopantetheinyl transferase family protein [Clostridium sporogenes]|uniref:4'-phosphopantetheinyl transferase family protein n=1 Tax=Clostridium sporogenes TaxID=1509 RepID=UPI0022382F95|nr:4'-phosphopantetheinyl transferase superfamily protein [Clostridium sporogenes]MCW6109095.1 4'-phosphopantetheinyl transferase superfamily protein [Clostridium sporogenes]